jgi:tetratricopeptide (TPR) repeat protein
MRQAARTGDPSETRLPPAIQAAIALGQGDIYYRQGEVTAALAAAERARALLSTMSSTEDAERLLARAETLHGVIAQMQGNLEQAEECQRRSLALRERLSDQQGMAESLRCLGELGRARGDHAAAEECYRRSLALAEHLGDQESIATCWHGLARSGFLQGDLVRAEECHRRALAIYERSGHRHGIAATCGELGYVTIAHGDVTHAERWYERALTLWEQVGHLRGIAETCRMLGLVADKRGDLGQAEAWFRRSMAAYERLGDRAGGLAVCNSLGCLCLARGALAQAEEYLQRAYSSAAATGLEDWITVLGKNLGVVALERGDPVCAAQRFRCARRRAQRSAGLGGIEAAATVGQAAARLHAGRRRAAAALIAHGGALAAQRAMVEDILEALLLTAELCLSEGRFSEAQAAAQDALRRAEETGRHVTAASARRLVGQCALAQGDAATAMAHLRTALAVQTEKETLLEAARTRLVLAQALGHGRERRDIPEEASTLLAEAQAQFATSGAARDVARAAQLAAAWAAH